MQHITNRKKLIGSYCEALKLGDKITRLAEPDAAMTKCKTEPQSIEDDSVNVRLTSW
jgi:hypothetical protein